MAQRDGARTDLAHADGARADEAARRERLAQALALGAEPGPAREAAVEPEGRAARAEAAPHAAPGPGALR